MQLTLLHLSADLPDGSMLLQPGSNLSPKTSFETTKFVAHLSVCFRRLIQNVRTGTVQKQMAAQRAILSIYTGCQHWASGSIREIYVRPNNE